jgi:hypothetical protein
MAEREFGPVITNSQGRQVPTRFIGEQHVKEDLGRIPTMADWFGHISKQPWMSKPGIPKEQRDVLELAEIPATGFSAGKYSFNAEVSQVLDISTVHITLEDSKAITLNEYLVSYENDYGWWLFVPDADQVDEEFWPDLVAYPMSEQFIKIMQWAQRMGWGYIRLDQDGPVYREWIEYHW